MKLFYVCVKKQKLIVVIYPLADNARPKSYLKEGGSQKARSKKSGQVLDVKQPSHLCFFARKTEIKTFL